MQDSGKIVWWIMEPRDWISIGAAIIAFAVYISAQRARRRDRLLELRRERYLDLISSVEKLASAIADLAFKIEASFVMWDAKATTPFDPYELRDRDAEFARRVKEVEEFHKCVSDFGVAGERVMTCADYDLRRDLIKAETEIGKIVGDMLSHHLIDPYLDSSKWDIIPSVQHKGEWLARELRIEMSHVRNTMAKDLSEGEDFWTRLWRCVSDERDYDEESRSIITLERERVEEWKKTNKDKNW